MIHAFAVEPELAATWGKREEFRYIVDKFGLGTPRVLLELPKFNAWRKAVFDAATRLDLSQQDQSRLTELIQRLGEHKHRRTDTAYNGLRPWLDNAEAEHARAAFAGILATQNPRNCSAVHVGAHLDQTTTAWEVPTGATVLRTAAAITDVLAPMLTNCHAVHLIDPHFGPENPRHQRVLTAIAARTTAPAVVVHCASAAAASFFQQAADKLRMRRGISVEYVRWREKSGQRFHNRYVLTELGGVQFGDGLDDDNGKGANQKDDVHLLSPSQYQRLWGAYVDSDGTFELIDRHKVSSP